MLWRLICENFQISPYFSMIKKIFFSISFFVFLVAGGILFAYLFNSGESAVDQFRLIEVGSAQLEVEIADTPSKWVKGLSSREGLVENRGMLFVFPKAEKRQFWMKGMKFPIDILWIRSDVVVGFEENIPPPADGEDPAIVVSPELVDRVLEVSAGLIQKLDVEVGDEVTF